MSSECVPDSTVCPSFRNRIVSACIIVLKRCAAIMTVFVRQNCMRFDTIEDSVAASNEEVASSINMISGFLYTARAINNRCFCPPLNPMPVFPILVFNPIGSEFTKSSRHAILNASAAFSLSGFSSVNAILDNMEPEYIMPSCITTEQSLNQSFVFSES